MQTLAHWARRCGELALDLIRSFILRSAAALEAGWWWMAKSITALTQERRRSGTCDWIARGRLWSRAVRVGRWTQKFGDSRRAAPRACSANWLVNRKEARPSIWLAHCKRTTRSPIAFSKGWPEIWPLLCRTW